MRKKVAINFMLLAFLIQFFRATIVIAITSPGDVQALMQIKAAIEPASINVGSCLASWDFSLDPCETKFKESFTCGFDCTGDNIVGGVQRVSSLQLDNAGYRGILSPSIGKLSALRYLRIAGNSLGGAIPRTIRNLSQLVFLDISANNFTGRIPICLGSLRNLQTLNLASNFLIGTIPPHLNNLISLVELRLENNNLNGSLPNLRKIPQLQFLDASNNQLSGTLPHHLPSSLCSLSLKNNLLSGNVPRRMAKLQQLNVLDVSGNQLTGCLDDTLLGHSSLQQLNLSDNKFTTLTVRSKSVSKSQIVALDLGNNLISGPLPAVFTSMKQLSSLSLRYNFFHGIIPQRYALKASAALSGTEPLERLMLDGNYLTGPIPAPFLNLRPDSVAASFADNCLTTCPERFFFCQGGNQKADSLCRLFNP